MRIVQDIDLLNVYNINFVFFVCILYYVTYTFFQKVILFFFKYLNIAYEERKESYLHKKSDLKFESKNL